MKLKLMGWLFTITFNNFTAIRLWLHCTRRKEERGELWGGGVERPLRRFNVWTQPYICRCSLNSNSTKPVDMGCSPDKLTIFVNKIVILRLFLRNNWTTVFFNLLYMKPFALDCCTYLGYINYYGLHYFPFLTFNVFVI